MISAVTVAADDIALSRVGDEWRFIPGIAIPATALQSWQQNGFDDGIWMSGKSGFSAGYIPNEATALPLSSYPSVCFRRAFVLTNVAQVQWLTLRIDYTDGFVAFLNGQEIARRNMAGPAGVPVSLDTLATNFHARGYPEELNVSDRKSILVPGTNTLAVQLHNARQTSVGLSLSAELLANFNRAPYLQNMSSNGVQIIWKTPVPADTQVAFGPPGALPTAFKETNLVTTHVITLTNLAPDTVYEYVVSSGARDQVAMSPAARFRTFKASGPLTFMAFGDGGWNSLAQYQIAKVVRETDVDFVVETGDIIYPTFTTALVDPRCFSVAAPHMATTPYFFAIGNHDINAGPDAYLEAFYLPTNSVSLTDHAMAHTSPEHYYSFDHGDAHFTVLFVPFISQYKLNVGDSQYNWLTNDLASTRQPWKIVVWHVPMNSSSGHRRDDFNYNGTPDRLEIRDVLLPVLSKYGVQLALCGHEHGYERFNPMQGVHSITTAGGGGTLYAFTELDAASAMFSEAFNCVKVSIRDDTLEAQALGLDGQVFDAMTIQRRPPEPKVYRATWNTPAIAPTPGNEPDGNIAGQKFEFQGEPIRALSGQFSNLGRAYVNNDRTNLYIGLEQVMLYDSDHLFLFIESSRLAGATNLVGLGNARIDPDGQGADGLDLLQNLSFTNFNPSVGCILGDELADGQFRSFARPNLALDLGQGVFRLDSGFSDVAGVRLQQFHLSPQLTGLPAHPSAAFIELSIPYSELGGLAPGGTVRIAAVVGGPEFNMETRSRFLDTGFLGNRMTGSGLSEVLLEGVEVQLASDPDPDVDRDGLNRSEELALGTDPNRVDTDGDGLPDGWEVANHLNPLSETGTDGANGDPDGDGASNLQELKAGTDPRDPRSQLRLRIEAHDSHTLRLTWSAMPGRSYQVESTSGSLTNFLDRLVSFSATNVISTRVYDLDLRQPGAQCRFYRLRLGP